MYDILKTKNNYLKNDVIDFAQKLIQTKSVSLKEKEAGKLCEKMMNELGYDKVFKDSSGNIVGIIYGRKYSPTILLNSHLDTVHPENEAQWEFAPHSGKIKNNKMYGLGASDCKAGVAAQIFSGALLKKSLLPLDGNLIVAISVAEENGLSVGVKKLLNDTLPKINLKPDYVILGEPTNLNIYYGHDGWVQFDILVDGANYNEVKKTANSIYDNFATYNDAKLPLYFENVNVKKPVINKTDKANSATINFSKRLTTFENYSDLMTQINQNTNLLKVSESVAVKVQVHEEKQNLYTGTNTIIKYVSNAWETDPFNKLIERAGQALEAASLKYKKGKWKLKKLGMGTAGNVISKEFNIPVIGYGPGNEEYSHEMNECVEIDNITKCVYGTTSIVHSLIGVPVFGWTSDEI